MIVVVASEPGSASSAEAQVQQLRLIVAALCAGLITVVAVFTLVVGPPSVEDGFADQLMLGLGVAAVGFALGWVVFRKVFPGSSSSLERPRAFLIYTLVLAAIAEGFGLFSAVFYFVTGRPILLVGVAVSLALLVSLIPREGSYERFVESSDRSGTKPT